MKKLRKEKGITLIALVITIIVLLILAGITIRMLTGESGILVNTELAKEEYEISQGKERIELLLSDSLIPKIVSGEKLTAEEVVQVLTGKEGISQVVKENENTVSVTITEGYMYQVTTNEEGKTEVKYVGKGTGGGVLAGTPIESITFDKTEDILIIGDTMKITASIEPADANQMLDWTSSDTNVATVNSNGEVTAVAAGTTTITATAPLGIAKIASTEIDSSVSTAVTATCTITVQPDTNIYITFNGVKLMVGDYVDYDCLTGAVTPSYTSEAANNGYAAQTFTLADYTYGWRVLGLDAEGQLLIIAEDFVPLTGGKTDSTSGRSTYCLEDQVAYVKGGSELEAICAIYGQGEGATGARSIKVEDINKITGYNPNNTGVKDVEQTGTGLVAHKDLIYEYGNKVTNTFTGSSVKSVGSNGVSKTIAYTSFTYYTGSTWKTLATNASTTLTSTYYRYYPTTLTSTDDTKACVGIGTISGAYDMLFTNSSTGAYIKGAGTTESFDYWLNSPCIQCRNGLACFDYRVVNDGAVYAEDVFYSGAVNGGDDRGVRPVVSLSNDIVLENGGEYNGFTKWVF